MQPLDDVNQNNDVAAINSLQAFINVVEAKRVDKISESNEVELITAAQKFIDLLTAE
jgi:hypothetical protein